MSDRNREVGTNARGNLVIKILYDLDKWELVSRVTHQYWAYGSPLPVNRKEAIDIAVRDIRDGNGVSVDNRAPEVVERINYLFPELT